MPGPIITLTTDFGSSSGYVAEVKAVLLSAVPDARLVDVAHDLPPQSIRHAEVVLRRVAFAFPVGTVHLVVVDPGVGTPRRPLAVQARGLGFVGPDNGVLGVALASPGARAVVLDRPHLFREPVSRTFHGRDVFAPVAAELAAGLPLESLGTAIGDALPSTLPAPRVEGTRVRGETLAADAFGNLATNVPARLLGPAHRITAGGRPAERVGTYGEATPGVLLALVGSDGYLEIAARDGSAARLLGRSDAVEVVCEIP